MKGPLGIHGFIHALTCVDERNGRMRGRSRAFRHWTLLVTTYGSPFLGFAFNAAFPCCLTLLSTLLSNLHVIFSSAPKSKPTLLTYSDTRLSHNDRRLLPRGRTFIHLRYHHCNLPRMLRHQPVPQWQLSLGQPFPHGLRRQLHVCPRPLQPKRRPMVDMCTVDSHLPRLLCHRPL